MARPDAVQELTGQIPLSFSYEEYMTLENFLPGANVGLLDTLCGLAPVAASSIWLWGANGSGKTHLLRATCRWLTEQAISCLYLSAADLRTAEPARNPPDLSGTSVLALDDVSLLAGASAWELTLTMLCDRLGPGGRLLFAASRPPQEVDFQLPDLASRMRALSVRRVLPLRDNDLVAMIQMQAAHRGLHLDAELGKFLLHRCTRDPASFNAIFAQLDQASLAVGRRLTVPLAKEILGL